MATDTGILSSLFPNQPNVRVLIVYNALQGLYLGYIQVFWQPFLVSLGISIALIGILESSAGSLGILSSMVQSFGGTLSDRIGRRKVIICGSALLVSCWSVATLAFIFRIQTLIVPVYVLWALGAMSIPALDAVLADGVLSRDRSRVYSIILIANLLPSSLTGYLAGQYAQSLGASTFLALAALFEGCGLVILIVRLRDSREPRRTEKADKTGLGQTLSNIKTHWKYFSVISLDSLAWAIGAALLYALLQHSQGYTQQDFGLIALTLPLGVVFGTIPGGWLALRIGPRKLLIFSEFLGAMMMFGWALYPLPSLIPIYGLMWGAAISTWVPVQFHLSSHIFPKKNRGELMGNLGTARGVIRALGPIIAVLLYLEFGYAAPMIGGGVVILLTIVFIAKFIPLRTGIVES
ncbi:MAG: MFS transporter [Nitrososphaerales archaeon]